MLKGNYQTGAKQVGLVPNFRVENAKTVTLLIAKSKKKDDELPSKNCDIK